MYKILRKETLNDVVELMEVHAPNVARKESHLQLLILIAKKKQLQLFTKLLVSLQKNWQNFKKEMKLLISLDL